MHILLVGFGNMGQKYLKKLEELEKLPVICDIDPKKATGRHPFYCHIGEVKEELKAVIVAIDPVEHVKVAKSFLERGIPVLLEKPPALTSEEFMEIYHYPHLYISEVESFSSCLSYFPKEVKSIKIERLGRGRGYISPLWDLAWHDLYLLQRFFKDIELTELKKDHIWELLGLADRIPFSIRVAWEHPEPSRKWIINDGELVLDFAKEEVWKEGRLIHRAENLDKLRLMVSSFLKGEYDSESKRRALKNIRMLEKVANMWLDRPHQSM